MEMSPSAAHRNYVPVTDLTLLMKFSQKNLKNTLALRTPLGHHTVEQPKKDYSTDMIYDWSLSYEGNTFPSLVQQTFNSSRILTNLCLLA